MCTVEFVHICAHIPFARRVCTLVLFISRGFEKTFQDIIVKGMFHQPDLNQIAFVFVVVYKFVIFVLTNRYREVIATNMNYKLLLSFTNLY